MNIRKADIKDVYDIKRLYRQLIARLAELAPLYRIDAEQDEDFIKDAVSGCGSDILVAEENGAILAFALLESREPRHAGAARRKHAFLMDICVDEEQRGRGIGSALLAASEEWAREKGLEYIELNVLEANSAAWRLYERNGFKKTVSVMRRELLPEHEARPSEKR